MPLRVWTNAKRHGGSAAYVCGVGLFPRRCAMCHSLTPPRKQNTTDRLTELTAVDDQRQRSASLIRCLLPQRSVQAPLGILTASVYHGALFGRVGCMLRAFGHSAGGTVCISALNSICIRRGISMPYLAAAQLVSEWRQYSAVQI